MDNSRSLLYSSLRQGGSPRALAPGTLRRIVAFAKPHSGLLLVLLGLSTVLAVLASGCRGERQLPTITRLLLARPRVVILNDEPLAAGGRYAQLRNTQFAMA
ncbi:MAG: hypothetical protein ACRDTG_11475 [Pseudonocardiaceae bacterium]